MGLRTPMAPGSMLFFFSKVASGGHSECSEISVSTRVSSGTREPRVSRSPVEAPFTVMRQAGRFVAGSAARQVHAHCALVQRLGWCSRSSISSLSFARRTLSVQRPANQRRQRLLLSRPRSSLYQREKREETPRFLEGVKTMSLYQPRATCIASSSSFFLPLCLLLMWLLVSSSRYTRTLRQRRLKKKQKIERGNETLGPELIVKIHPKCSL